MTRKGSQLTAVVEPHLTSSEEVGPVSDQKHAHAEDVVIATSDWTQVPTHLLMLLTVNAVGHVITVSSVFIRR